MRRLLFLSLFLSLFLLAIAVPARAQRKDGPVGVLVTAQTGTTLSSTFLRNDNYIIMCFEYDFTGTCTAKLRQRINKGTIFADVSGSSVTTTDTVFCVGNLVGEFFVDTSTCSGSVTVTYHTGIGIR